MNFIKELEWRGMLHDSTPGIEELLSKESVTGYIGFDPTASSLTIGNYVQIMLLDLFQRSGHRPIALMGGATGMIGDPSGKDAERQLMTMEELRENQEKQSKQLSKFLETQDGPNSALFRNNFAFYKDLNVLEFLRTAGKHLTVNYMMSKDSVKNRLESGISYTEFSYQVLQAYDFVCLYNQDQCVLQMGGSDQWGNIVSGTELVRRMTGGKAHGITTPLLTKSNGQKFGKSEEGNIWLDPALTSPYQFYQFWINADDTDIPTYTRYITLKSQKEVEDSENDLRDDPRQLKRMLAEELTSRVHSPEDFQSVLQVSELLFNPKVSSDWLNALSTSDIINVKREITSFDVPREILDMGTNIVDLMTEHTQISPSKSQARQSIKGSAVSVNKQKVDDETFSVHSDLLLKEKYLLIDNGKKHKFLLEFVNRK